MRFGNIRLGRKVKLGINTRWKVLAGTSTLAYWAYSKVTKRMKCREYSSIRTSFSVKLTNGPSELDCYITLGWKGLPGTDTSLLGPSIIYKENEVS
jgi:hypothetical protein